MISCGGSGRIHADEVNSKSAREITARFGNAWKRVSVKIFNDVPILIQNGSYE